MRLSTQAQKFFISFNSRDQQKAHWIAYTLREAGHSVAVHDWEIPAGGNAPVWMDKKLAWADRLIAVVSPDYVKASYSMMERAAGLWDDPEGDKGSVVPVLIRPTRTLPPLLRGLSCIDLTGVDEETATKRLVEGVEGPRPPLTRPRFEVVPPDAMEQGSARRPDFSPEPAEPADSTTRAASPAAGPAAAEERSDEQLLEQVSSRDPLLAFSALGPLKSRSDLFERLLDLGPRRGPVPTTAIRIVLRTDPGASAKALMERTFDEKLELKDWHKAMSCVDFFDRVHQEYCEWSLGEIITAGRDFDTERVAIEAMGRCLSSPWGGNLLERVGRSWDDDTGQKLGSYVLEALARMFLNSDGGTFGDMPHAVKRLTAGLRIAERTQSSVIMWRRLSEILSQCGPRHIDGLISGMLQSDSPTAQRLAAEAMGTLGVERASGHLKRTAETSPDATVVNSCSTALGLIASDEAVDWLERGDDEFRREGLVFALDRVPKEKTLRHGDRYLASDGQLGYVVIRAFGRVGATERSDVIREYRTSTDPVDRAVAVLALARLRQLSVKELTFSVREASQTIDRLFSRLALISVSPDQAPGHMAAIREDLADESHNYWGFLQEDILDALTATGDALAIEVADAWRPFYYGLGRALPE